MKKRVNLLITDLDDTIWDWLHMWHASFSPYLDNISRSTGIKQDQLISEFRIIHQKYGTSECSYAYKELKSLKHDHIDTIEDESKGQSIITKYHEDRKNSLKLHDGVYKTLHILKQSGIKIVGFTESNVSYAKFRIKSTGLDGVFDCIYSTEDHKIPETVQGFYPVDEDYREPEFTRFEILPAGTKKPDPGILLNIISRMEGQINNTIYIGDKLDRDIYMASLAAVTSVHAAYGHVINDESYELLKKVTHWSEEDIQREIEFKMNINKIAILPDHTIDSFENILRLFDFFEF